MRIPPGAARVNGGREVVQQPHDLSGNPCDSQETGRGDELVNLPAHNGRVCGLGEVGFVITRVFSSWLWASAECRSSTTTTTPSGSAAAANTVDRPEGAFRLEDGGVSSNASEGGPACPVTCRFSD